MENENKNGKYTGYFSKRLKAGKRRTYFFDVRSTKQGDFFLTITESKKKFDDSYESHKIFLYKEDFKKFLETLNETVDYIKTELMPGYDYDAERPAKTNNGQEDDTEGREERRNNNKQDGREERRKNKEIDYIPAATKTTNTNTPIQETTNPTSNTPPHIGDDEQIDWN